MKRVIFLLIAVFSFCISAGAQAIAEPAASLMTYKNGRLYLDGDKLSRQEIREIYPDGYKKYTAGRVTRGAGIGVTVAGAATLGVGTFLIFDGKHVADKGGDTPEESLGNGLGGVLVILIGAAVDLVGAGITAGGITLWGSGSAVIKSTKNKYNRMSGQPASELTFGSTGNGFGLALNF